MENRYQDDALIINPAIIEIMSREYFDVINKKSKPLESQNQPQNKIFLKKHVHELVLNLNNLIAYIDKNHEKYEHLLKDIISLSEEIINVFHVNPVQTQSLKVTKKQIFYSSLKILILMLQGFQSHTFLPVALEWTARFIDIINDIENPVLLLSRY